VSLIGLPAKVLGKALVPVVGGAGKELGALIADQLRFIRWKNAVGILHRAAKFARARKVKPHDVPVKFWCGLICSHPQSAVIKADKSSILMFLVNFQRRRQTCQSHT
jgi:hypothetical protein